MTCSQLHGFVEFIGDRFPTNNDYVAHCVEIVSLVVELFSPFPPRSAMFSLLASKVPTDDGGEDQYHAHHDIVWLHELPRAYWLYALGINQHKIIEFSISHRVVNL